MLKSLLLGCIALFTTIQLQAVSLETAKAHPDQYFILYDDLGEAIILENDKVSNYLRKFRHIAIFEKDRAGIPASIKMAQGILESGAGESKLAKIGHNHFGIKCGGSWDGETYYMWDDDVVKSCFRVFNRDEESYVEHTKFLTNPKKAWRYGPLFQLDLTDYKGWANGLQKAGYATAKTYGRNLISLIERYELYKLDHLTFDAMAVGQGELDSIFQLPKVDPPLALEDTISEPIIIPDPFGNTNDSVSIVMTKAIFQHHNLNAVYVQASDTYDDIAFRYDVKLKKLHKYNETPEENQLHAGEILYLQKKNKKYKGKEKYHIVRAGQTMYDIAQLYGLRLKSLIKLNKVYKDKIPLAGTKIRLKKK
jgi:hypothetical protein